MWFIDIAEDLENELVSEKELRLLWTCPPEMCPETARIGGCSSQSLQPGLGCKGELSKMKRIMKLSKHKLVILMLMGTICLILPVHSRADKKPEEVEIPQSIYPGLHHFFDLVDPEKNISFDPGLVARVMKFIEEPKNDDTLYFADGVLGMPSAYHEFDSHADLRKITEYAFNPDIPGIATMPSSVRLIHWMDAKGQRRKTPRVERYLGDLDTPVVEKTMQYVEITPDTNSGAYYGYNLHQTLIVFKYRQRKVLISLSRQADVSSVGKKGYVLGKDDDWDYFYSNKKGLTLPTLGWINSYIYGSGAINIYYEIDPGSPKVRCAMFKWLRAGWSGINMVQRKHIYKGLKRFARPFKEIIEYPSLPPVEVLASDFSQIRKFSDDALRAKMDIYSNILKRRYIGDNHSGKKWLPKLLADKDHWSGMSREEMESALVIEYMKAVIGKTPTADIEKLLEF